MELPKIELNYLDPIKLDDYEHVSVELPDGRTVTVYSDKVYVSTEHDVRNHKSGRPIWKAGNHLKTPYGRLLCTRGLPCSLPTVAERSNS